MIKTCELSTKAIQSPDFPYTTNWVMVIFSKHSVNSQIVFVRRIKKQPGSNCVTLHNCSVTVVFGIGIQKAMGGLLKEIFLFLLSQI